MYGFELEVESRLTENLTGEAAIDYVIGSETDSDQPLPYMPPLRTRWSVLFDREQWWTGIHLNRVSSQTRTAPGEEQTDGYILTDVDAGYRIGNGIRISARLDNAMDVSYKDHLSRIEEQNNPMPGRNLNISVRWDF